MELYSAAMTANQKSADIGVAVGQRLFLNNSAPVRVMAKNTAPGTPTWSAVEVSYWEGQGSCVAPSTIVQIWCGEEASRVTLNGAGSTTAGGEAVTLVSGQSFVSIVTVTRPANTTAYTAGDVVGQTASAILNLTSIGPAGGGVIITGADLRIDVGSVPSGMGSFRLHLYSASPTAIADNAAWTLATADRDLYRGYIDLGSPAVAGSSLYCQTDGINKQFEMPTGQTQLYGLLVTNGGYTPAGNSEVYKFRLRGIGI